MRTTIPGAEALLDKYFPVLDYGFIALKDYLGGDEAVEEAARVSYGAGTRKVSETRGLLRYLMSHRHTTPFEMVELKFHIGLPIMVARQWIRHRASSFNEYSGRYSLMPQIFYTPDREHFQTQSVKNRQGRSEQCLDQETYDEVVDWLRSHRDFASAVYNDLLQEDVARELARMDLPLSMYTYWYWKIDLHNLFHFLSVRMDSHAQYEIRVYADAIAGMVKEVAPLAFEAFIDYRLHGTSLSRNELKFIEWYMAQALESYAVDGQITDWREKAASLGMNKREIDTIFERLTHREPRDYTLDLSRAKDGSHFEQIIKEHSGEPCP